MPLRARLLTTLTLLSVLPMLPPQAASELSLQAPTSVASEGYITLYWTDADEQPVAVQAGTLLQLSASGSFQSILRSYPLVDQSQVSISGLSDGNYYSRLVDSRSAPLSDTATFKVEHRNLTTAWLLFALGALLFSLLIIAVLLMARKPA